jgi:hypothetical protein
MSGSPPSQTLDPRPWSPGRIYRGTRALCFPLAFVVLFFMVRLVPRLISPPLVIRNDNPITVLNLTEEERRSDPEE